MTKLLSQLQASTGVADNDLLHQGDTSAGDDKKLTMAELRAYLDGYYAELSRPNRNLIANGAFRVNQQGSTSKTEANPGWNYDTWYYTGTYLETFVEEADIFDGTFTLSWASDATAEWVLADAATGAIVGTWAAVSNGGNFTLTGTAGNHLWIRFAAGTAGLNALDLVQLEVGSVATDFERRNYAFDLSLVESRYWRPPQSETRYAYPIFNSTTTLTRVAYVDFKQTMREAPIVSLTEGPGFSGAASIDTTINGAEITGAAASSESGTTFTQLTADARPPIPV